MNNIPSRNPAAAACLGMLLLVAFGMSPARASVDLVRVDKSERRMFLLAADRIIREFRVALGANPQGHKEQQGDERTPEGRYILDYVKEDSDFYRAMHISYPSPGDSANAQKRGVSAGGQIMIHGQSNGLERITGFMQLFNWTDGCIALTNSEMDDFLDLVPVGTPIEIHW